MPLLLAVALAAPPAAEHGDVFRDPAVFAAWPANGGLWSWGDETVLAFVTGKYHARTGHNAVPPFANRVARTTDGGKTWAIESPKGFYQTGDKPAPLDRPIPFTHSDFALRVVAEGYQGGAGPGGQVVVYSTDRGRTWAGPFLLPKLIPDDEAGGRTEVTNRTDYVLLGPSECLLMGSARYPGKSGTDRAFAAKLHDGGRRAEFLGWIVPPETTNRLIMPATVPVPGHALFAALRVRQTPADENRVDGYRSEDDGKTWKLLGKVGDTGAGNGNPPAELRLRDGRLVCAYGDRTRLKLFARLSGDDGKSWGEELVLRAGYVPDAGGEVDFGYPRLFQRKDGAVVCVYYWADAAGAPNHIAVTTLTPPAK